MAAPRHARRILQRLGADRPFVILALADGYGEAVALRQDYSDRTHLCRLVAKGDIRIRQVPRFGIDDQVLLDARPDRANTFLRSTSLLARMPQLAQDAAIEVEQYVRMRCIDRPVGEQVIEMRSMTPRS